MHRMSIFRLYFPGSAFYKVRSERGVSPLARGAANPTTARAFCMARRIRGPSVVVGVDNVNEFLSRIGG
jgi:hypothetical protein